MTLPTGTAPAREIAMRFGSPTQLVGVLTNPPSGIPMRDVGVLTLNSGLLHRIGAGRFHVLLARALAPSGFPTLRFDFSGIGDSDVRRDGLGFLDGVVSETRAAMDHLAKLRGIQRFVLVGLCSGADAGFYTAQVDERVVGLVQLDPFAYRTPRYYLHRYGPKLLNRRSWLNLLRGRTYVGPLVRRLVGRTNGRDAETTGDVHYVSPYVRAFPPKSEVEKGLRALVGRGVRLYHLFSSGQDDHYNYERQYRISFRSVPFGDLLTVAYLPKADHVFSGLSHKQFVVSSIVEWVDRSWPRAQSPEAAIPRAKDAQAAPR